MSNVVVLRRSKLREASDEIEKMKPTTWVVIGMTDDQIMVLGNDGFDMIQMFGMLEYAKTKIESRTNNEPTPKRFG